MKIINARDGREVWLGDVVEGCRLVRIIPGLFHADLFVSSVAASAAQGRPEGEWLRLPVRYLHPAAPFRRMILLPT